jgi:hypothetical protein
MYVYGHLHCTSLDYRLLVFYNPQHWSVFAIMDDREGRVYLSRFIGKNLRIHTSDHRVFGGQMKCTDKVRFALPSLQPNVFLIPSLRPRTTAYAASIKPSC